MRTTITISDELLESAKQQARQRGQTLGGLIETALRNELARPAELGDRPVVPVFSDGTGPRPGVDLTSNRGIYELLDEGVDPLARR